MDESWKQAVGFEGSYEVSDLGRVRRCGRDAIGRKRYFGHIMKPGKNHQNYFHHVLRKDGKSVTKTAHRLVSDAFLGARPEGLQVNHKNGERADNQLENLEYVTASENYRHALSVLQHKPVSGEQHWNRKLTEDAVRELRRLVAQGHTQTSVAATFGVARTTINRIVNRLWWKHVA